MIGRRSDDQECCAESGERFEVRMTADSLPRELKPLLLSTVIQSGGSVMESGSACATTGGKNPEENAGAVRLFESDNISL